MRSLNEGVALFAADALAAAVGSGETWAFVCECGAAECDAWIELELAEYGAIRDDPDGTIVATGHVATSPSERARRESAERRGEARGLREQAKQPLARGGREVGRAGGVSGFPQAGPPRRRGARVGGRGGDRARGGG